MTITSHNKNKFFFYFLGGIALPCLLLGFFAYRGIQNDRALYEQQTLNKNQIIARRVIESIHDQITDVEQACPDLITSCESNANQKIADSLEIMKSSFPLVEEFFSLQRSTGKIDLPTARLLFTLKDKFELSSFEHQSVSSNAFAEGVQNEFQQRAFQNAIDNYQQAYLQEQDVSSKADILNAIARVQKKTLRLRDALKSYQTLRHNFGKLHSRSGIPYGLASQIEAGFIYASLKDTLSAVQSYLNAFNELFHGSWSLEKAQYDFWSETLKDSLNKLFSFVSATSPFSSYLNVFKRIVTQESVQREITERLISFQTKAGAMILDRIASLSNLNYQFSLAFDNRKYFISLLLDAESRGQNDHACYGILWRIAALSDSLGSALARENLDKNNIVWQVLDADDRIILKAREIVPENSRMQLKATFINHFPDWTVVFYHQNPHLIESILTSRRSIYFYIFILIAGILIFGSILTFRSVSHELELAKMKSDFVSSISHELKSPLTSIRQLAEMLQRGRVPSEERRQKYYDVIVEQSEKLSLLINNVLDYARMDECRKQFYFEATDIERFLKEITASFQQQVCHDNCEIIFQCRQALPLIAIDRTAIAQAITNLLDNAIKYSDQVKKIIVRLYLADQNLAISVQDSGIGIPGEDLEKIFEQFYRGNDAFVRSKRGSGLGLTLVRQIVQAHQGSIEVASELGRGSTFTIILPISTLTGHSQ